MFPEVLYSYTALSNPRECIRLVTIDPGTGFESIRCVLQEHCLQENIGFEALSYRWGSPEPPAYIEVDGGRLRVTRNLKSALAFLRFADRPRTLWVDAICINQNDLAEKTTQVELMRRIYQTAEQTIAWLGELPEPVIDDIELPRSEGVDDIIWMGHPFRAIEDFAKHDWPKTLRDFFALGVRDWWRYNKPPSRFPWSRKAQTTQPHDALNSAGFDKGEGIRAKLARMRKSIVEREHSLPWEALEAMAAVEYVPRLEALLNNDWMSRVWILQEVSIARSVKVLFGNAEILWDTLIAGLTNLRPLINGEHKKNRALLLIGSQYIFLEDDVIEKQGEVMEAAPLTSGFIASAVKDDIGLRALMEISKLRDLVQSTGDKPCDSELEPELRIMSLVKQFREWESTDPRDKIYALLALSSTDVGGRYGFRPDYQRSAELTYSKFAHAMVLEGDGFALLANLKGASPIAPSLASWVPDWSDSTQISSIDAGVGSSRFLQKNLANGPFKASGNSIRRCVPCKRAAAIATVGHAIDEIAELGNSYAYVPAVSKNDSPVDNIYFDPNATEVVDRVRIQREFWWLIRHLKKQMETLAQWQNIAEVEEKKKKKYATGESQLDAYRRTVNLGRMPTNKSDKQQKKEFDEWRGFTGHILNTMRDLSTWSINVFEDDPELLEEKLEELLTWAVDNFGEDLEDEKIKEYLRLRIKTAGLSGVMRGAKPAWNATRVFWTIFNHFKDIKTLYHNPNVIDLENLHDRRLARTRDGLLAVVPATAQKGDNILLLSGGATPYVGRCAEKDGDWVFVGDAYVHGIMQGEKWNMQECHDITFV